MTWGIRPVAPVDIKAAEIVVAALEQRYHEVPHLVQRLAAVNNVEVAAFMTVENAAAWGITDGDLDTAALLSKLHQELGVSDSPEVSRLANTVLLSSRRTLGRPPEVIDFEQIDTARLLVKLQKARHLTRLFADLGLQIDGNTAAIANSTQITGRGTERASDVGL